jgi:hypothetical protein
MTAGTTLGAEKARLGLELHTVSVLDGYAT